MTTAHSTTHDGGSAPVTASQSILSSTAYDAPLSQQQTPPQHLHQQTPSQGLALTQQQQQQQRSVKRPRPVKSCTECRKRKLRCDRLCPCSQCQKSNRTCKYAMDHDSANLSEGSDSEMPEPARPAKRNCNPGIFNSGTPLPSNDSTYGPIRNGDTGAAPSLEELSMRMERLERQLMARSPVVSEGSGGRLIAASSETIRGLTVKQGALRTRYHGQNSPRVLLNLFDEAKEFMANNSNNNGVRDVLLNFKRFHKALIDEYRKSLSPITVFVDSMMPVQKRMTDILPKKALVEFEVLQVEVLLLHAQRMITPRIQDSWTSLGSIMQVYAAMTLGVRMKVAHMLNRIDTIRDYQEILEVGAKLERFLDDINYIFPRQGILSDAQKSKQWRSRVILDMHVRRPLLALYRPFAIGASDAPGQISRAYLRSSMVIMKYLDELDPMLAHFQDIAEMYHQVLKKDIIQAALSVCFYIRSAVRPASDSTGLGSQALRMSPDSSDDFPTYNPENLVLWSPSRLISTVEKTLDLLVRNISGRDTKDVVCLAVVLECVSKPEVKTDEVTQSLRIVLDRCLRATNMNLDGVPMGSTGVPVDGFQGDAYRHHVPFMYQRNSIGVPAALNDFDNWMLWEGWE
ncbi:Activator of stress proteins 1 [Fusarium odoratissimum]|nr:Activator of stress proteins 1 [Fusarium odoratissimum]